ncbi:unnamed protein product [Allacma fusca]|uniref:ARF7 effector protein C-terminal domain-containing protein n=1 Tax=Allacma fusca TaxID=39272 RepID=A0A8J2LEX1_9HEXA|nr:unnamed protein product [Allacma fusca]
MTSNSNKSTSGRRVQDLIDDDILEIMEISSDSSSSKQEEERRNARQREQNLNDEMKFMADFDPDNSLRKQKKNKRRYYYPDGRPIVNADEFEICDCLEPKCPGCHFPCKSCGDGRCGHECRTNRRWVYDTVEIEGRNKILKHPQTEARYGFSSKFE